MRVRELVVPLPVPAVYTVDHLREGEYRCVAGRQDGKDGYDDEDGLEHPDGLREEVHAEVDEGEVFAPARGCRKGIWCALRAAGHGVVGAVLESNTAEQEGDNAGHVPAVGEEVGCVRDKGDEARLDL